MPIIKQNNSEPGCENCPNTIHIHPYTSTLLDYNKDVVEKYEQGLSTSLPNPITGEVIDTSPPSE